MYYVGAVKEAFKKGNNHENKCGYCINRVWEASETMDAAIEKCTTESIVVPLQKEVI